MKIMKASGFKFDRDYFAKPEELVSILEKI